MKKLIFFILSGAIVYSCQSDFEYLDPVQNETNFPSLNQQTNETLLTRASPSVPTLIQQAEDTNYPLHIIMDGRIDSYLSVSTKGVADLYRMDDRSGRQRWVIQRVGAFISYRLRPSAGVSMDQYTGLQVYPDGRTPQLQSMLPFAQGLVFELSSDDNKYFITQGSFLDKYYMMAGADSGTKLISSNTNIPLTRSLWKVTTAEQCSIYGNFSYYVDTNDIDQVTGILTEEYELDNRQGELPGVMRCTFSKQVNEQTSFSEQSGYSIRYSTTENVTVPDYGSSGLTVDGSMSYNYTTGTTQNQSRTLSLSVDVNVPAGKYYRVIMESDKRKVSATYVGSFRGKETGKILQIKGKWNGIVHSKIKYTVYDITNQSNVVVYQSHSSE